MLKHAIDRLVARHETLRTGLSPSADGVLQVIRPSVDVDIRHVDLSRTRSRKGRELVGIATEEARRPFHLPTAPLFRVALVELGRDAYVLLWTVHHAICDYWSVLVARRELPAAYAAASGGSDFPAELPIQFGDYAAWERGAPDERSARFWEESLAARRGAIELPSRSPHDPRRHSEEGVPLVAGSRAVVRRLTQLGRAHGATLAMVVLAATAVVFCQYGTEAEVPLALVDANRDRPELRDLFGCCITFLPVTLSVAGNPSLASLLGRTRDAARLAYAYRLPLGQIAAVAAARADLRSRGRPYDVLLNFIPRSVHGDPGAAYAGSLSWQPLAELSRPRGYVGACNWSGWPQVGPILAETAEGDLRGTLLFNSASVEREVVRQCAARYVRVLREFAARPWRRLSSVVE